MILLEVVVELAGKIIAGVVTDLITGKTKIAQKMEIEREVAIQLAQFAQKQRELDLLYLKQRVIDEIIVLVSRNPEMQLSGDEITLRHPQKFKLFKIGKESNKNLLLARLQEMDAIVLARRRELGLPTSPEEYQLTDISHPSQMIEEQRDLKADVSIGVWSAEIDEMKERIRQRRDEMKVGE